MEADMELIVKMKAEKAGIEDNVYRLEQINNYNTDLDAQIKEAEKSLARAKTDLDKETKGTSTSKMDGLSDSKDLLKSTKRLIKLVKKGNFNAILESLQQLPDGCLNMVHGEIGPLHAAIGCHDEEKSLQIIEFMLCFGLDVNLRTRSQGLSPLHLAVSWEKDRVAELLLDFEADRSALDAQGRTPFDLLATDDTCSISVKAKLTHLLTSPKSTMMTISSTGQHVDNLQSSPGKDGRPLANISRSPKVDGQETSSHHDNTETTGQDISTQVVRRERTIGRTSTLLPPTFSSKSSSVSDKLPPSSFGTLESNLEIPRPQSGQRHPDLQTSNLNNNLIKSASEVDPGFSFSPSNNRGGHEAAVNEVAKSASLIRHTDTVEGVILDEIITTSNNPMPSIGSCDKEDGSAIRTWSFQQLSSHYVTALSSPCKLTASSLAASAHQPTSLDQHHGDHRGQFEGEEDPIFRIHNRFTKDDRAVWEHDQAMAAFFHKTASDLCNRSDSSLKGSINALTRNALLRSSFNYLLLDPRRIVNIKLNSLQQSVPASWRVFLDGVFYVGKGTRSRPYAHLYEAVRKYEKWRKAGKTMPLKEEEKCEKTRQIMEIWSSGLGVVCLQLFQHSLSVEALTREAAMIQALESSNCLTNVKKGDFYGVASEWSEEARSTYGYALLFRAFKIFINEGERQLRPLDLRC